MKTETTPVTPGATPAAGRAEYLAAPAARAGYKVDLENILVPLDLSDKSLKALQYAIPLAQRFGAKLTLLHVVPPPVYTPDLPYTLAFEPRELDWARERLKEIRETEIPADMEVVIEVRNCFVFEGIVAAAHDTRADLIVTTTHGYTGLKHMLMGSAAENLVRIAPCPVLVLHETERDFVQPIVNERAEVPAKRPVSAAFQ